MKNLACFFCLLVFYVSTVFSQTDNYQFEFALGGKVSILPKAKGDFVIESSNGIGYGFFVFADKKIVKHWNISLMYGRGYENFAYSYNKFSYPNFDSIEIITRLRTWQILLGAEYESDTIANKLKIYSRGGVGIKESDHYNSKDYYGGPADLYGATRYGQIVNWAEGGIKFYISYRFCVSSGIGFEHVNKLTLFQNEKNLYLSGNRFYWDFGLNIYL